MKKTIAVEQRHIEKSIAALVPPGRNWRAKACPIAFATSEALGVECIVDGFSIFQGESKRAKLPEEAKRWINAFDNQTRAWRMGEKAEPVKPITFEIELPDTQNLDVGDLG